MLDVTLIYPTPEGSQEIPLDGGSISMGRGSDADLRFEDDGLSRLHATVFREGDRVWILDEGSTNGTTVNGNPVPPSGTPLHNGDSIKIGHYTNIRVFISERKIAAATAPAVKSQTASSVSVSSAAQLNSAHLLPIMLTLGALVVIGAAAVFIGVKVLGNNQTEIVRNNNSEDNFGDNEDLKTPKPSPSKTEKSGKVESSPTPADANAKPSPIPTDETPLPTPVASGKKYQQMTAQEKNQYIQVKAEKVARMIGNRTGEPIPPAAVDKIRGFLEGYVSRLNRAPVDNCTGGGWLKSDMNSVLKRAAKNAPTIIPAFGEQGMDPQIGLYLAMIESEHCGCLQSGTGPLGIFQFTFATGKTFFPNDGAGVVKGSTPSNPDIRCQLEPASKGSAKYMKFLTGWFGTGPLSFPLAIGSYNSGEGAGAKNLREAMSAGGSSQERSFWTLVANADKLGTQFQLENFKYVPKFFAAAIIGENPQDFGVDLQPLSTYTK